MTGLAKGIFSLAFIALLVVQPTGQWFCTATNSFCPDTAADCCARTVKDCCDKGSDQNQESPCCIEISGEWQVVPATSLASLPEPLAVELLLPGVLSSAETPTLNVPNDRSIAAIDPPRDLCSYLEHFCVRLI